MVGTWITAAFRSSTQNEAYLFMKTQYLRENYAPGSTRDKILQGPVPIDEGYPSLAGTDFANYGVDCALGTVWTNKAYIFSGDTCARINYAAGTSEACIKQGPMTIGQMFPFLKGTAFESGVDSAFESTVGTRAYLFRGNQCAVIDYGNLSLVSTRSIRDGFPSLKEHRI